MYPLKMTLKEMFFIDNNYKIFNNFTIYKLYYIFVYVLYNLYI